MHLLLMIVGLFLLIYVLVRVNSLILSFVTIYISISLIFGSIYHYIYSTSKETNFIFSEAIISFATIKENKEINQKIFNLNTDIARYLRYYRLVQLSSFDFVRKNKSVLLDTNVYIKHFTEANKISSALYRRESNPRRSNRFRQSQMKPPLLVDHYCFIVDKSDSLKIGPITKILKDTSEVYSKEEILAILLSELKKKNDDLNELFNSFVKPNFEIFDFYYFAFTIIGASDIIAANTKIRILVVFQMLIIAIITGFVGRKGNKN